MTNSNHPSRNVWSALLLACTLLAPLSLWAAGGIANVRVSQRPGTDLVDIHYDLTTAGSYPMLVTVAVSTNGGLSYTLPATSFTGAVGPGVTPGVKKSIVWDAGRDWPGQFSTNVFFRLTASDMVLIPAGSFTMGDTIGDGSSDERPTHTVSVSAFYMDRTEVTKAFWDEVRTWAVTHGYKFDYSGSGKAANHPVWDIDWSDAVKWCNARSEKEGRVPAYSTSAAQTTVYRTGPVDVHNDWVK